MAERVSVGSEPDWSADTPGQSWEAVARRLAAGWWPITVDGHAYPNGTWVPCWSNGDRRFDREPEPMTDAERALVVTLDMADEEDE